MSSEVYSEVPPSQAGPPFVLSLDKGSYPSFEPSARGASMLVLRSFEIVPAPGAFSGFADVGRLNPENQERYQELIRCPV